MAPFKFFITIKNWHIVKVSIFFYFTFLHMWSLSYADVGNRRSHLITVTFFFIVNHLIHCLFHGGNVKLIPLLQIMYLFNLRIFALCFKKIFCCGGECWISIQHSKLFFLIKDCNIYLYMVIINIFFRSPLSYTSECVLH